MSTMYGADADELDRLAAEFRRAADELDREGGALTGILNNISWLGDSAGRFLGDWTGIQLPKIGLSTRFLRNTATELSRNATQQRNASRSTGGSRGQPDWWRAELVRMNRIAAPLDDDLERVDDLSPAAQLAWWRELTEEQRSALIAARPHKLIGMEGLPSDVRQRAEDSFLASLADQIVTSTASISASAEFTIKVFKVGGELEVEQTTYADGSVAITLGAAVFGGVGLGQLAKAMADRGLDGTYRFRSQAEADAFLRGLIRAAAPEDLGDLSNFAPEAMKDIITYLVRESEHLESVGIDAGGSFSMKAKGGVADFEVGGFVRAERNLTDGTTTLSLNGHLAGGVDLGGVKVAGEVDGSVAVAVDGGSPTKLTLDLTYENGALGGTMLDAGIGARSGVTSGGTMTVSFDLTDPDVMAALGEALPTALRGDMSGVVRELGGTLDLATIVIQSSLGAKQEVGFDATVLEAKVTSHITTAVATYVKPPGGGFREF